MTLGPKIVASFLVFCQAFIHVIVFCYSLVVLTHRKCLSQSACSQLCLDHYID